LSATATTAVVAVSLVATALLVPVALHMPRWLEAEAVLGTWWVMGAVALSVLLFRGARLADDFVYRPPWHRPGERRSTAASSRFSTAPTPLMVPPVPTPATNASPMDSSVGASSTGSTRKRAAGSSTGLGSSAGWLDPSGCLGVEGCAGALVGILLAAAAFAAAWLVVELVAPIVFLLFYAVLIRAVARVTRDNRGCKGNIGRSLAWGLLWASTYAAPVLAFVWLLQAVIRARGVGGI
jgi:hypothetical protein